MDRLAHHGGDADYLVGVAVVSLRGFEFRVLCLGLRRNGNWAYTPELPNSRTPELHASPSVFKPVPVAHRV